MSTSSGKWLDALDDIVGRFEARKIRARERLANQPKHCWYFAILGLELENESLGIEPIARFARVAEPPGEIELAGACSDPSVFGAVGRYSHAIRFELVVTAETPQSALNRGWWILSALRVRTCAELLVAAVADHSWSAIAGIDDRTCHIQLIEDHPRTRRFEATRTITANDVAWVQNHLTSFMTLLEKPTFRHAVDALCTNALLANARMSATMLWSGIEALFSISSELRFRLAACIAAITEPRGEQRISCYRRVKRLYDFRSRLVHGANADDRLIVEHIVEVRKLLSRLLCLSIEEGSLPHEARIEDLLFG